MGASCGVVHPRRKNKRLLFLNDRGAEKCFRSSACKTIGVPAKCFCFQKRITWWVSLLLPMNFKPLQNGGFLWVYAVCMQVHRGRNPASDHRPCRIDIGAISANNIFSAGRISSFVIVLVGRRFIAAGRPWPRLRSMRR
jgi:hypothetical protein